MMLCNKSILASCDPAVWRTDRREVLSMRTVQSCWVCAKMSGISTLSRVVELEVLEIRTIYTVNNCFDNS